MLALAVPAAAEALPVYVVREDTDSVDRYDAATDGRLAKIASTGQVGTPFERLTVLGNRSGVFSAGTASFTAFKAGAGGALTSAGSDTDVAIGIASHPLLPVIYYLDDASNELQWRRVQPDGTAFITTGGQGGSRTTAVGDAVDVVVSGEGQAIFAAVDNTVYRFPLNADGSIPAVGGPTTEVLPPTADIRAMAVNSGGGHLYAAGGGAISGFVVADVPLNGSDDFVGGSTGFAPSVSTNAPNKLAAAPDGFDIYGAMADGTIERWATNGAGVIQGAGTQVANNNGGGFSDGEGITVSPGGGSVYASWNSGGVAQYTRQLDGTLAAKSPRVVPDSAPAVNLDIAYAPLPVPFSTFTVAPAPAGSATSFDATGSIDPDNLVNRFDWNFGDGTSAANAGPMPTHVYSAPGAYTATLTAVDTTGTPTTVVFTGHVASFSGGPSSSTSRSVSVPAGPAAQVAPTPPPVARKTVVVKEVSGSVLVKVPGSNRFVPLSQALSIPVGSQIDTRRGRVQLTSAADSRGTTQSSLFYDGIFKIGYATAKRLLITEAALVGKVGPCPKAKKASASAKRRKRRLWGNGKGRFRTKGKRSSALVRGTIWLVEDRCDGTLTRVTQGSVTVRDFAKRKNVIVKKGKKYLARAKRPKR